MDRLVSSIAKMVFRCVLIRLLHVLTPDGIHVWTEIGVGQNGTTLRFSAIQINHRKGRNHENMMAGGKLTEVGGYRVAYEYMRQSIGSGSDGISRLLLGKHMNHRQLS